MSAGDQATPATCGDDRCQERAGNQLFRLRFIRFRRWTIPVGTWPGSTPFFFSASATQSFASPASRAAFRQRWLGRYIEHFPECTFLALDHAGRVAGYIVGALADPALDPLFSDIGYFRTLAPLTARFPAHLHINLAADARNRGIGGRLIEAFCDHARAAGAPGVHVVTAEHSRNRSFYARLGFALEAKTTWNGQPIVFLARRL